MWCVEFVGFAFVVHALIEARVTTEESDMLTERKSMSASAEAAELLRHIAGSGEPGETKKAAWLRAYRKVSRHMSFNRVKDLWREEVRAKVSAEELELLRRAAGAVENDGLIARVEALEQQLRALAALIPQDADFYRANADLMGGAARQLGRADHPET